MSEVICCRTTSAEDTERFAAKLAEMLKVGDTVFLSGDLGTGKSVLARGIARALGVVGAMPSPTFTLVIPHKGKVPVYHFDLYRLADPDGFYAAGLDEMIGGDGVALVEWPEMADPETDRSLWLTLSRGANDDERSIEIRNDGVDGFDALALSDWKVSV
ncbi:MAG: tRNA (adenosine(37)-N6)-threonylcarbamoyltransferase complex ATPase subunit type 1 TsaE [Clostridia bacterium]|nr:tRNA (adenosine(37)-N6)-threonylcarbamoyltransferase complex ATPase subunit type 1 TsaE [Clostridia bacterium]